MCAWVCSLPACETPGNTVGSRGTSLGVGRRDLQGPAPPGLRPLLAAEAGGGAARGRQRAPRAGAAAQPRGRARRRAGSGPASYAGSCGRDWRHFLERRRPLPGHLGVGRGGARRGAGGARARHGRGRRRGAGVLSPGRRPGMGVSHGPAAGRG